MLNVPIMERDSASDIARKETFKNFIADASSPLKFDKDDRLTILEGFAERVLFCDWQDDKNELVQYFNIFVYYCLQKVPVSSVSKLIKKKKLSELFTVAEEAFAFLVLESNILRWKWLVENKDSTSEETAGDLPGLIHQKTVRKRKEKSAVNSAGEWTDMGMKRFNGLVALVQKSRSENSRKTYEGSFLKNNKNFGDRGDSDDDDEGDNDTMPSLDGSNKRRKINEEVVVIDLL